MRQRVLTWLKLEPGEGVAVSWAFVYFFLLLASYYILRPLRDEMGIAGGIDKLPWVFTGTFVAMLVAVPLFGWITARPAAATLSAAGVCFLYFQFAAVLCCVPSRRLARNYGARIFHLGQRV